MKDLKYMTRDLDVNEKQLIVDSLQLMFQDLQMKLDDASTGFDNELFRSLIDNKCEEINELISFLNTEEL